MGPVNASMFITAQRIVAALRYVLRQPRRRTGRDELHRLEDRFDSKWEERVVVERPGGVVGTDRRWLLQQDRTGVDARIDPENRRCGRSLPFDDLPVDGAAAAVLWQRRR